MRATKPLFGFFFYQALGRAVCPHLTAIMIFQMPIRHLINKGKVDAFLAAWVYVLQLLCIYM
jgi:hypothetical protein